MLPTFILAGAAKAGTTSLWEYLSAHPQVAMATLKEPGFFTNAKGCGNRPDPRAPRFSGRYAKGLAWYESLFRECEGAKMIGEASTTYMPEPDAPELIHKHAPNVQLLFLLRDPAERVISHYWQERRHGWSLPTLAKMMEVSHPTLQRYHYVSSYQLHLQRYQEYFPREQMLILFYDDLRRDPIGFIKEVYRFLGVDEQFQPPGLGKIHNPAQAPVSPVFAGLFRLAAQHQWRLRQNRWLSEALRPLGRKLIQFGSVKTAVPASEVLPQPGRALDLTLRQALCPHFTATIDYLEETCQRDLTAWRN